MKFIDFFAGIGGFHSGLEKAGMKCIGWCEYDKKARRSYKAMYDTKGLWTADDVRLVRGWNLPGADLWSFGFPCQDVSIAGRQRGMERGTRSGLFFEIMRLLDEREENKPKWLLIENVKNLLSNRGGGHTFFEVLYALAERGYSIEWNLYNSKNYGVPQNRERVYIVCYLGDTGGRKILPIPRTCSTNLQQVGNLVQSDSFGGNPQRGRVYATSGVAPTLTAHEGGGHEPKILIPYKIESWKQRGYIYDPDGIVGTITANDSKGPKLISEQGEELKVRKLTPRECWRLQEFTDEQFDKAAKVNSATQLYRQAGNAVTVNVVHEIGEAIVQFERQ